MIYSSERGVVRERVAAVLAAGALVMSAACSSSGEQSGPDQAVEQSATPPEVEQSPSESAPMEPETVGENSCEAYSISVYPGSRFNEQNAGSINKQLNALAAAKTPGREIGAAEIGNALAITANASVDNVYAAALSEVNQLPPDQFPTAEELLAQTAIAGGEACLTKVRLRQVNELFQTLVIGLGSQAGRQLSAVAQVAYDRLEAGYREFQLKYTEELLESPSN